MRWCFISATFKLPESVKWLKLNYRNTGFYIVDYKDAGWAALRDALSSNVSVLTQEDRASLIHNIFALSRYGEHTGYSWNCSEWQAEVKWGSFFQFLYLTFKKLPFLPVLWTDWGVCPSFMCATCWTTCPMKLRLHLWQRPCYSSTISTSCSTKDKSTVLWPAWRYLEKSLLGKTVCVFF